MPCPSGVRAASFSANAPSLSCRFRAEAPAKVLRPVQEWGQGKDKNRINGIFMEAI